MAPERDELFLIDGNSLAYRAFFALPEEIATSDGFHTNAIFGFASMLVKILTDLGPKATVVVWDAGYTGRKEVYADYKAQRATRPDLLKEQWPHLAPLVEAFGYRNVSVEGYEADDVIASIVEKAKAQDVPVMVVTGDRDAYQLVDGGVRIMTTSRGITDTRVYDREGVVERYGIEPELIPDFIGLKGDTSDNIPGVPGIGDKTAAQLLQQFGSLEAVLENVDQISGAKRKQNLVEHAEDARVSKRLATMVRDIGVDVDPAAELSREPDRSRLREVFRRFELREPLRRLEEALDLAEAEPVPAPAGDLSIGVPVRAGPVAQVGALRGPGPLAVAVRRPEAPEGALFSQEPWRYGAFAGGEQALAGEAPGPEELVEAAGDRPVAAHDAKSLRAVPPNLAHDTMVGAYLIDPAARAYPLDELCSDRGVECDAEDEAAREAILVHWLAGWQRETLREREAEALLDEVELPLVHVLRAMEVIGVKLDTGRLAAIAERVHADAAGLEKEVHELAGEEFTIGSPQQLSEVLFGKLGLSRKRRGKTGYSTDARVLQAIRDEHEVIPKIERWRELTKLESTYLLALPELLGEDGRLHTTFNQTATTTGRLSSTDPNLQNIPIRTELGREIRACFVAEPGSVLVSADYSQVELRVLAHIAGEQVLRDIFARGEDVHTATAGEVLGVEPDAVDAGTRSKAKMINYGIVYGLSGFGLADRLQIPREEADAFIETYLDRFPAVRRFIEETIAFATEEGYVATLFGRRRRIPELRARNRQTRQLGERLAVNTVIQGTAADVIKMAMVRAHRALAEADLETRLVLQIHDELLFEGPAAEAPDATEVVRTAMERAADLDPPLAVDIGAGPNWMEAK
ncbi:MAG TPA: DNA polymerase I [Solirubrobacteraceae bacterium]|nr:DNA polymerase I [Solirubrobacteraceae bacterium]